MHIMNIRSVFEFCVFFFFALLCSSAEVYLRCLPPSWWFLIEFRSFFFYLHFLYPSMLFIFSFLFFNDKSSFTACGSSLHWSIPFSFHFLIENSIKWMDFKCVFVVHRTFCFLFYYNLMFSVFIFHLTLLIWKKKSKKKREKRKNKI